MSISVRLNKQGDETFRASVYDPSTQKEISVGRWNDGKSTFGTRKGAERAIAAARAGMKRERKEGVKRVKINDLYEAWISEVAPNVAPRTLDNYDRLTRRFRKKYGEMWVDEFDQLQAAKAIKDLPKGNIPAVRIMWNRAVAYGLTPVSPFKPFKAKRAVRTFAPGFLSHDEIEALAQAARDRYGDLFGEVAATAIIVAAWTCIRPSELWALRMRDIDLYSESDLDLPEEWRQGDIYFTEQLGRDGQRRQTKTGDQRSIILPPAARRQILRSREAVEALGGGDQIVCGLNGQPMRSPNWQGYWKEIRKDVGREDLVFYALRHFGATYLREIGVSDADIANQLGHANTKLVNEVYTHMDVKHSKDRVRSRMYEAHLAAEMRAKREPLRVAPAPVVEMEPQAPSIDPAVLAQAIALVEAMNAAKVAA